MPIRYLLDENVDPMYKAQLLRREQDLVVWTVGDPGAPQVGSADSDILCWCEDHDFILITSNRKSMPGHLADHLTRGRHVPGIFTLNPELSVGQTIEELLLIAAASDEFEYQDYIVYLPMT